MLEAIATSVTKIVDEFTWKRFLSLIVFLVIVLLGFLLYERYTSNFQLSRIQKTAEILELLQKIQAQQEMSPEIALIHSQLAVELEAVLNAKPWSVAFPEVIKIENGPQTIGKFIAGGFLWILFACFTIPGIVKKDQGSIGAFIVLCLIGIFFGWVGTKIPTIWWPWMNLIIYPIGHVFLIVLPFIAVPQFKAYKRKSEEENEA